MNARRYGLIAAMVILTGISCGGPQEPAATGEPAAQPQGSEPATAASPQTGGQQAAPPAAPAPAAPAQRASQAPAAPPQQQAAAPRVRTYTVPEGAEIKVRTTTALSTKDAEAGAAFTGSLAEPLIAGDTVIAPKGALVHGRVAESDPGGRVSGRARIAVRLASVELEDGKTVALATNTVAREAQSSKKKDAVKVGVGAGLGAAIGAIAGGGKGAGIGAAAGAGAGTGAVLATRGDPAVIPAESVLTFTLRSPVSVTK